QAALRAHRYESAERRMSATYDLDMEIEEDKKKRRMAVDQCRASTVMDFVQRVRESRTAQDRRRAQKRVTYASVVQEMSVPQFGLGFALDTLLPKRHRTLHPEPKDRAAVTVQLEKCRLLVQLVSARNVPIRSLEEMGGIAVAPAASRQNNLAADDDLEEDFGTRKRIPVSSFVEVTFQDTRKRTTTCDGLAPLWKESLGFPFMPPMGDYSPAALAQVRDMVMVTMFDEVEYDDRGSGGYLDEESSIRREKHFLGSINIPFQTIYQEGRIDGFFRLTTPPVNLGYEQSSGLSTTGAVQTDEGAGGEVWLKCGAEDQADSLSFTCRSTYVRVLATLDPIPVVLPRESIQGNNQESQQLISASQRWMKRVREHSQHTQSREPELFVPDMFGNDVLICSRYLCPQEPPPGLDTISKCVHFVRLLPFLEDWQAFEGEGDMWCTSQQFLDILAGDDEEHAVLLHNYILCIIMKHEGYTGLSRRPIERTGRRTEVYIVIGRAMPEGNTIYVMVQELTKYDEPQSTVIWKPSTGDGFDARDRRCPLVNVYCVVSQDNVWANIQNVGKTCEMSLDLRDRKCW
ncbi:unnamed protein product, partial [Discosporangium mesarthrocarpum]